MNPQLNDLEGDLPSGSLLCVPNDKERELSVARPKVEAKKAQKAEAKEAEAPKSTRKKSKSKKETEEPDEGEWETLAEYATKGAPKLAARSVPELPPSKFIGSNGNVVWIPAAKPKPQPKPKSEVARGELTSRKGKAIHGILQSCRSHLGTPYVWGGEQPGGFDCSGYVQYVWAQHGYRIPRTADIQYNVGEGVKRGQELPGDLVFFETYAPGASHVGVYLGRGYFIHASSSRGVTIDRLATDFFAQRYLGAKRTKW
ncbi:MAG: C40 family peptidase [Candidatus Eremiobacteraeota bacterium]|nr:C40 family peptidase [Candidatus Eremiobacteraeota bacterium]